MAVLTWRNVDVPNFGSSIANVADAGNNISNSFNNLGAAFDRMGQRLQDQDTGAAELALQGYGSNGDLQAAIRNGLVGQLSNQYGSVDKAALARALQSRATALQTQEQTQQGIDKTNNLNQFGGQLSDLVIRARQGDGQAAQQLQGLQQQGLLGSVAADFATPIANNLGQYAQDAETSRAHRANEGLQAQSNANQAAYQQGQLALSRQRMQQDQLLNQPRIDAVNDYEKNRNAGVTGLNAANSLWGTDSNQEDARSQLVRNMVQSGANPDQIKSATQSFDAQWQLKSGNAGTKATRDALSATVDSALQPINNQVAGTKQIITDAYNRSNPSYSAMTAAQTSTAGINTIPDAVSYASKAFNVTDRKTQGLLQDAVQQGLTVPEATALLTMSGRGAYSTPIKGDNTIDSGAYQDNVKYYLSQKQNPQFINDKNTYQNSIDNIDSAQQNYSDLLKQQQDYLVRGRTNQANRLNSQISQAKAVLDRTLNMRSGTAPVQQTVPQVNTFNPYAAFSGGR